MFLSKKHKRPRMTRDEANAIIERSKTEEPLELEKGDKLAMLFAAIIVFLPFVLVISGVLVLIYVLIFVVLGGGAA